MKTSLEAFNHIFTQDHRSKTLLEGIGFKNITVSGDTRFDRVSNQLSQDNTLEFIEQFKNKQTCLVFGSTWPDDDKLYFNFINSEDNRSLKYIIAPHNIKPSYVASIKSQLKVSTICYSDLSSETDLGDYQVFILDTIGLLSKVYHYADIAYVGGAAGRTGLHNILEPAVFGIPVLIGDNYHKFPEAKQLIELGGVTSVSTAIELSTALSLLINDDLKRKNQGQINASYISKNQGAVIQILNYIRI
jgi:3-deoxy-D-manno-octulosonic-acid transferase